MRLIWADLVMKVSFLSWPVVGPVLAYLFGLGAQFLFDYSAKFANWVITGFQVDIQESDYSKAVEELKAEREKAGGDLGKLQQASDKFDSTLTKLVHYDTANDRP